MKIKNNFQPHTYIICALRIGLVRTSPHLYILYERMMGEGEGYEFWMSGWGPTNQGKITDKTDHSFSLELHEIWDKIGNETFLENNDKAHKIDYIFNT